jgi:hypothetical protein
MQNLIAKTAGVVVAIALFVGVGVTSANALTVSEITALLVGAGIDAETAATLAAVLGEEESSSSSVSCGSFTRDLTIGSTGSDVVELQTVLEDLGYLTIPAGVSKGYFGALTQSALASMQAAEGISPASGYFGPITRSAFAGLCSSDDMMDDDDSSSSSSTGLQGGAGDIDVTERSSGVKDEVMEGEEENVLGFEVESDGSDVEILSVKVQFEHTGSGSDRLDRYVDEVKVIVDGDEVGSADVDDFNEDNDVYSESIEVSGVIIEEDEQADFHIAISALNNIDSDDLNENWTVTLENTRFADGDDAIISDTTGGISEVFTFEDLSSSGDVELTVEEDDNTVNEPHSVEVDDTSDTNDVEVLSFTLRAEGSDQELKKLIFDVDSIGAGVTEIANEFRLMMGNDEVGTAALSLNDDGDSSDTGEGTGFASSTDTSVQIIVTDIDDDDVILGEDDEVEFMLVADINDIDGGFSSGAELSVSLTAVTDDIDAEDENGDTVTDLKGSADSTDIEFLSTGISVEVIDVDATTDTKVSDEATDDQGKFVVEFEVTAIQDAAYLELGSATRGEGEDNTGVNFVIQDQANDYEATTTGSIALSDVERVSGGTVSGDFIKIGADQSARFRLTVDFDPAHTTGSSEGYRLYMYSVNTAATAVDATAQQVLTPEVDYRTGPVSIGN